VHGGHAGGGLDFRVGGVGAAVADVVRHRVVEEDRVLGPGPRLTTGHHGGGGSINPRRVWQSTGWFTAGRRQAERHSPNVKKLDGGWCGSRDRWKSSNGASGVTGLRAPPGVRDPRPSGRPWVGHHRDALPHGVECQGPEVLTVQQDGGQPPGVERSAATNGLCDVRLQVGLCDLVPFRVITPWAHRRRSENSRSEHRPRWFLDPRCVATDNCKDSDCQPVSYGREGTLANPNPCDRLQAAPGDWVAPPWTS